MTPNSSQPKRKRKTKKQLQREATETMIVELAVILAKFQWCIVIPKGEENDEIRGMVIGDEGFIYSLLEHIPDDVIDSDDIAFPPTVN